MAFFFFNALKSNPTSPSLPPPPTASASNDSDSDSDDTTNVSSPAQSKSAASPKTAQRHAVADYVGVFDLRTGSWTSPRDTHTPSPFAAKTRQHPFSEQGVNIADLDAEYAARNQPSNNNSGIVRIVAVSDTHSYQDFITLPRGDILLHAGDWLMTDFLNPSFVSNHYIEKAFTWFNKAGAGFKHSIHVHGNHDDGIEKHLAGSSPQWIRDQFGDSVFLDGTEIVEACGIRFFGNSWSTPTGSNNKAFQDPKKYLAKLAEAQPGALPVRCLDKKEKQDEQQQHVEDDDESSAATTASSHQQQQQQQQPPPRRPPHRAVDILLTHCNLPHQRDVVARLNPGLHVCGHYHGHHGLRRGTARYDGGVARFEQRGGGGRNAAAAAGKETDAFFQQEVPVVNAAIVASLSGNVRLHPPVVFDVIPQ